MPTTLRIPPGVVISDTKASVLGRWNSANLVRWQEGRMKPVGGYSKAIATPLTGAVRNGHVWLDNQYRRNAGYMCDNKIYRQLDSGPVDITPPDFIGAQSIGTRPGFGTDLYGYGLYGNDSGTPSTASSRNLLGFPIRYAFDNWGEQLLFGCSTDGRVFYWDPETPNTKFTQAEGLPGNLVQDFLVTEERHLMIFGYAGFPNRVAWSEQEDRTNWDFQNVNGSAGFQDLLTPGNILTARRVTGGVLVFTTTTIFFGRYIGAPYFYSFTKLAEGQSPISPQAVVAAGSRCYWMGHHSFYVYDSGQVVPLQSTLGSDVFDHMDEVSASKNAYAGFNSAYPEIWFFYPRLGKNVGRQEENNAYAIFNYVEGWWSVGALSRTFFQGSPIDQAPIAGDVDGNVYTHEQGYLAASESRLGQVWAEATLSFDDGWTAQTAISGRVDPALDDPKSVQFTVNARLVRGGASIPKGPYIPRADGKIDFRFTAVDFDFRITGLVDGPWAFGAMVLEARPRGSR